jgi:hypothetical protein
MLEAASITAITAPARQYYYCPSTIRETPPDSLAPRYFGSVFCGRNASSARPANTTIKSKIQPPGPCPCIPNKCANIISSSFPLLYGAALSILRGRPRAQYIPCQRGGNAVSGLADQLILRMIPMKRIASILLGASLLAGCAQRYDMILTNGVRLTNVRKPVLDKENSVYVYKDGSGNPRYINAGRVVEIKPHSSKDDEKFTSH